MIRGGEKEPTRAEESLDRTALVFHFPNFDFMEKQDWLIFKFEKSKKK